jgi:hypothetical protein
MNFFTNKKSAVPQVKVVGLKLHLSDGYNDQWFVETTNLVEEKEANELVNENLKQCQQALEEAERLQKLTVILPRFGLISLKRFERILSFYYIKK